MPRVAPPAGLSNGAKVALGIGIGLGGLVVLGLIAAITMPAFLALRDQARHAELESLTRTAAIEVEVAATAVGGDYTVLDDDIYTIVDESLEAQGAPDSVVLARNSSETFWSQDTFSICIEDQDTGWAAVYRSDQGLLGASGERCAS